MCIHCTIHGTRPTQTCKHQQVLQRIAKPRQHGEKLQKIAAITYVLHGEVSLNLFCTPYMCILLHKF